MLFCHKQFKVSNCEPSFVQLIKNLRPAYRLPDETELSNSILDSCYVSVNANGDNYISMVFNNYGNYFFFK